MNTSATIPLTLLLASFTALGSGCATVAGGTSAQVTFRSLPEGAEVQVETVKEGKYYTTTTPGTIKLPKKNSYLAQYEMDGYHTVTAAVDRRIGAATAGSIVGNALIGGVIGATVDTITGANMNLPKEVRVELTPATEAAPPNAGTIAQWRQVEDHSPIKQESPPVQRDQKESHAAMRSGRR